MPGHRTVGSSYTACAQRDSGACRAQRTAALQKPNKAHNASVGSRVLHLIRLVGSSVILYSFRRGSGKRRCGSLSRFDLSPCICIRCPWLRYAIQTVVKQAIHSRYALSCRDARTRLSRPQVSSRALSGTSTPAPKPVVGLELNSASAFQWDRSFICGGCDVMRR